MPRIPTSLLLKAYRENPLLLDLLKECRTLEHARNELRWLREGAIAKHRNTETLTNARGGRHTKNWRHDLGRMCADRGRGKPLQYILGDQPFGDLEILCEKGVLIPRLVIAGLLDHRTRLCCVAFVLGRLISLFTLSGETESYTSHARDLILKEHQASKFGRPLRILDLCSGSGCISLLLHSLLAPHVEDITIVGVDANPRAIRLSHKNRIHNLRCGLLSPRVEKEVTFLLADVLDSPRSDIPSLMDSLQNHFDTCSGRTTWDVLISNPPYVSPSNLINGTTSRSVRRYEPTEALVPPAVHPSVWQALGLKKIAREDIFYVKLLSLARQLDVRVAVLECGDLEQAQRVVTMAHDLGGKEKKEYAYIWDDCYTTTDQDSGSRAVILERVT